MTRHGGLSTPRVQISTLYFVALLREELGRRIAAARVSAGLSQQELASAIGLKHSQDVSRYERGKVEVPAHRIDLIAEATNRPRSYFTRGPEEAEPAPPATKEEIAGLRAEVGGVRGQLDLIEALLRELTDPQSQTGKP